MKHRRNGKPIAICTSALVAAALAPAAHAFDVTAGDWKLSVSGNVNADYIYSNCESTPVVVGGGLACAGDSNGNKSSSVSNGLLPAALAISGSTTQSGYDIGVTFGLYPGISTNDGGSPNIQGNANNTPPNTALGTAGLDVRQVFLTFGNKDWGTILAGRNIGLFGADAILNDMTLLGVGGGNGNYASPTNTSLGSIGLGYIYTDWLAQIDYTTPDLSGAKITVGIFNPLNSLTGNGATVKKEPGFHAKVAYTLGDLYLSGTFLYQKQADPGIGLFPPFSYNGHAFDIGGKYKIDNFEVAAWYYNGKGVGTTGLFVLSADDAGNPRNSDGFLAQVTYKLANTKLGVNYGQSKLDLASGEVNPTLLSKNDKYTLGVYQSLTSNLIVLAEFSTIKSEAQDGLSNTSRNFNIGAFVSF